MVKYNEELRDKKERIEAIEEKISEKTAEIYLNKNAASLDVERRLIKER